MPIHLEDDGSEYSVGLLPEKSKLDDWGFSSGIIDVVKVLNMMLMRAKRSGMVVKVEVIAVPDRQNGGECPQIAVDMQRDYRNSP